MPFLKLKARFQLLEGDVISAIQLYDKAVKLTGTPNSVDDYDLSQRIGAGLPPHQAPADRRGAGLLEEVAKKFPEHVQTRLLYKRAMAAELTLRALRRATERALAYA